MEKERKPLTEKDLVELTLGYRQPVTEDEKELAKEIKEIEAKGRIVEIPKEWP
jgi:tRNA A-37 threonylcarbamoyl transferase component Bud32